MIMPAEKARSHRHTPNALRLIIDAEPGAYTIVNGERLSMMLGDVLTPNWCWHGHGNDSRANAYRLDVLDVPLVHLLEPYASSSCTPATSSRRKPCSKTNSPSYIPAPRPNGGSPRPAPPRTASRPRSCLADWAGDLVSATRAGEDWGKWRRREEGCAKVMANSVSGVAKGWARPWLKAKRGNWSRGQDDLWCGGGSQHSDCSDDGAVQLCVTYEPVTEKLVFFREGKLCTSNAGAWSHSDMWLAALALLAVAWKDVPARSAAPTCRRNPAERASPGAPAASPQQPGANRPPPP